MRAKLGGSGGEGPGAGHTHKAEGVGEIGRTESKMADWWKSTESRGGRKGKAVRKPQGEWKHPADEAKNVERQFREGGPKSKAEGSEGGSAGG